jgi:hypothetical protein
MHIKLVVALDEFKFAGTDVSYTERIFQLYF